MIHNRIYGEVALWTLPSREFRLLVAPIAVTTATRENLLDIDALDVFLRSRPGPPCTLRFFSVGTEEVVRHVTAWQG